MLIESGIFLFFLVVGLCIGSFLNVVIYRIPAALLRSGDEVFNIAWPPSHCFSCQSKIKKRDNIPVISWVFLKGKCRFCGSVISSRYPLIEFATGGIFALIGVWMVAFCGQDLLSTLPVLFLFAILLCLMAIDFDHLLLPDNLVFTLLWMGLVFSLSGLTPVSLENAVLGVVVTWLFLSTVVLIFTLVRKREGMGAGDIKLYSALGAWLGWQQIPSLLVLSSVLGMFMFVVLKKRTLNDIDSDGNVHQVIPFGPAIALSGFFIYLLTLYRMLYN